MTPLRAATVAVANVLADVIDDKQTRFIVAGMMANAALSAAAQAKADDHNQMPTREELTP